MRFTQSLYHLKKVATHLNSVQGFSKTVKSIYSNKTRILAGSLSAIICFRILYLQYNAVYTSYLDFKNLKKLQDPIIESQTLLQKYEPLELNYRAFCENRLHFLHTLDPSVSKENIHEYHFFHQDEKVSLLNTILSNTKPLNEASIRQEFLKIKQELSAQVETLKTSLTTAGSFSIEQRNDLLRTINFLLEKTKEYQKICESCLCILNDGPPQQAFVLFLKSTYNTIEESLAELKTQLPISSIDLDCFSTQEEQQLQLVYLLAIQSSDSLRFSFEKLAKAFKFYADEFKLSIPQSAHKLYLELKLKDNFPPIDIPPFFLRLIKSYEKFEQVQNPIKKKPCLTVSSLLERWELFQKKHTLLSSFLISLKSRKLIENINLCLETLKESITLKLANGIFLSIDSSFAQETLTFLSNFLHYSAENTPIENFSFFLDLEDEREPNFQSLDISSISPKKLSLETLDLPPQKAELNTLVHNLIRKVISPLLFDRISSVKGSISSNTILSSLVLDRLGFNGFQEKEDFLQMLTWFFVQNSLSHEVLETNSSILKTSNPENSLSEEEIADLFLIIIKRIVSSSFKLLPNSEELSYSLYHNIPPSGLNSPRGASFRTSNYFSRPPLMSPQSTDSQFDAYATLLYSHEPPHSLDALEYTDRQGLDDANKRSVTISPFYMIPLSTRSQDSLSESDPIPVCASDFLTESSLPHVEDLKKLFTMIWTKEQAKKMKACEAHFSAIFSPDVEKTLKDNVKDIIRLIRENSL